MTNLILPEDLGEATIDFNSTNYHFALAYGKLGEDGNIAKHSKAKVSRWTFDIPCGFQGCEED